MADCFVSAPRSKLDPLDQVSRRVRGEVWSWAGGFTLQPVPVEAGGNEPEEPETQSRYDQQDADRGGAEISNINAEIECTPSCAQQEAEGSCHAYSEAESVQLGSLLDFSFGRLVALVESIPLTEIGEGDADQEKTPEHGPAQSKKPLGFLSLRGRNCQDRSTHYQ